MSPKHSSQRHYLKALVCSDCSNLSVSGTIIFTPQAELNTESPGHVFLRYVLVQTLLLKRGVVA